MESQNTDTAVIETAAPVETVEATEEETAPTCCIEGCEEEVDEEGDHCEDAYYCESCSEPHHIHEYEMCSGCENGYRGMIRCADSCERCFYCERCETRHRMDYYSLCSLCDSCTEHHDCRYCEGCGDYHAEDEPFCGECDSCTDRCDCEEKNMTPYMRKHPIKFWPGKPTAFLPSKRYIAAEIEIASGGYRANETLDNWHVSVVPDGSVSNGCELNTAPAIGDTFIRQITEICRDMAQGEAATVDNRCGLHLHVDARDFSYPSWARLLWIWAHIESAVYSTLPNSRRSNTYCQRYDYVINEYAGSPRKMTGADMRQMLVAAIRQTRDRVGGEYEYASRKEWEKERVREVKAEIKGLPYVRKSRIEGMRFKDRKTKYGSSPGGSRYYGLNLQAAFEHGTVEFRCHSGTVDAEKITNWAVLCTAILDTAKKYTLEQVQELRTLESWAALMRILPHDSAREYFTARRAKFA